MPPRQQRGTLAGWTCGGNLARTIIEAEVALLDWAASPAVDDPAEVVRELKILVKGCLALHVRRIDDPAL